ncbi:hypothetical protein EW146_g3176 [Bondarzewia mesenterica]|uniref:Cytochrome P450 n=1 Tax=Bondarzewia mesenterica TaxID=1095465 RepID=A0A4S4LYG4_9AGAM|nr:hypothetical protein EW146_g3176 [Bondarzewia mesenterica]
MGAPSLDAVAVAVGLSVLSLLYLGRTRKNVSAPLPPGPKRLPIIGNMLDMPKGNEWFTYEKWGKEFGSDIVHVDVLGTDLIIVNSAKAANELFEKRSSLYSDRPKLMALNAILKLDWVLCFIPYGPRWRAIRKAFHGHFHPTATLQYQPMELKASHELLRRLLDKPEEFVEHLRHMAGEIIMGIAYGIEVKPHDDPYIEIAEKTLQGIALASGPEGGLYDMAPALLKMPDWFPGSGHKKELKKWIHWGISMVETPYRTAKEAVMKGSAVPSVTSSMISQVENQLASEIMAKEVPANMYLAGADTTVSALTSFFLAMSLYPEAMKKAQAEIDTVIGGDRLPDFSDEQSLPYVSALVKEVLRWRPVVPLAIPHRLVSDDIYEGYFIPGGSIVIGNGWAMLHDESIFPDAGSFKPEHFLDPSVKFPEIAFGFGRRICPGRFMARASVWIAIASVLAVFDISKAVDENGKEIEPVDEYTSGIVVYPIPFKCKITPRSNAAEDLMPSISYPTVLTAREREREAPALPTSIEPTACTLPAISDLSIQAVAPRAVAASLNFASHQIDPQTPSVPREVTITESPRLRRARASGPAEAS